MGLFSVRIGENVFGFLSAHCLAILTLGPTVAVGEATLLEQIAHSNVDNQKVTPQSAT